MSLIPITYVDNETIISATNLNNIQSAIVENENGIVKVTPITGIANPTSSTIGALKQFYLNTSDNSLWLCTAINGSAYTWVQVSGGGSGGGVGLIIKGYYPTLQALQQAVPNPSVGDAYGVGSAAPYEIYIWSGSVWVDNGTIKGEKGDDGYSPEVTITQTATGHDVTITDEEHPSGQTFSVDNGTDGTDGEDGEDGVSPTVTVTTITGGHRVTITDAEHPSGQSFDVMDGTGAVASVNGQTGTVVLDGADINVDDTASTPVSIKDTISQQSSQIVQLNTTVGGHTTDILNLQRRTKNNITSNLANLPTAIAQQNLEKYGYAIGDYFVGASGYTYWLADMDTYYGGYNSYAVVGTHHCAVVVDTKSSSQWDSASTAPRYDASALHTYLSGTVLNNVKSDLNALFGSWSSHIISHEMLANGIGTWGWSGANYIRAMTELEVYGSRVWSADNYQQGEAVKQLELFRKFRFNEIFGNAWFWLRSLSSSSIACIARDNGLATNNGVANSNRASGLILLY